MASQSTSSINASLAWIGASIIFVIGLITPYLLAPYGMNLTDEPYHLMNYNEPLTSPASLGNNLIYHLLLGLFSNSHTWLIFRCINIAFAQLAIISSAFFMAKMIRKLRVSMLLASVLLLTCGLLKNSHYNLIGYNCLPVFISILSTITFLIYYQLNDKSSLIIFIAGLLSGFLAICLLPSSIIIIIGTTVIITKNTILNKNSRKLLIHLLIYFAGVFAVIAGCIYIVAGIDIHQYFALLSSSIAETKGHDLSSLVHEYFKDFINILIYVSILWSISLITQFSLKQSSSKIHNLLVETSIFVIASIFLYFLYFQPLGSPLPIASVILLLCYSAYLNRHNKNTLIALLTIFVCGFTVMSGSNTGFSKYIGFASFPLIISYTIPVIKHSFTRKTVTFMVIFVCFNVAAFAIRKNHVTTFFDDSISRVNVKMHEPKYPMINGLYTTPERAELVHNIITDFSPYHHQSDREVLIIGNDHNRFFFQYIFNARDSKMRHAWDYKNYYHDPEYLEYIRTLTSGNKSIAVLYLHSETDGVDNPMYKLLSDSLTLATTTTEGPYSIFVKN